LSTVAGELAAVDTGREARGFGIKPHTKEAHWDWVGKILQFLNGNQCHPERDGLFEIVILR
jgi:Catalase